MNNSHPDPRIGKHGAYPPRVCAVTERPVAGLHSSHIGLGSGFYCSVLEIARHQWTDALKNELSKSANDVTFYPSKVKAQKKESAAETMSSKAKDDQSPSESK